MENQTKFCPKCGNELKADAKFCPKCGFALADVTATTSQVPVEPTAAVNEPQPEMASDAASTATMIDNAKVFTGNYFKWYWETLKHPGQPLVEVNRSFGVVSFALEALLIALAALTLLKKVQSIITYAGGQTAEKALSIANVNGVIFKVCLTTFIVIMLSYGIYTGVSYAFRRMAAAEPVNFWDFVNRFAALTNLIMIFNFLILIICLVPSTLSLMSGPTTGILIVTLALAAAPANLIITVAYIFVIVTDIDQKRMDKFYVVLLAEIALTIVFAIFVLIVSTTIGASFVSYFENLQHLSDLNL